MPDVTVAAFSFEKKRTDYVNLLANSTVLEFIKENAGLLKTSNIYYMLQNTRNLHEVFGALNFQKDLISSLKGTIFFHKK